MLQRCSIMRRHPTHQPVIESRKFVRGLVQFAKIDPRLQDWKIRPNTRSPKRQNLTEFHSRDSLICLAGVAVKRSVSQFPNTIYAANSQKVVSAGFSNPMISGNFVRACQLRTSAEKRKAGPVVRQDDAAARRNVENRNWQPKKPAALTPFATQIAASAVPMCDQPHIRVGLSLASVEGVLCRHCCRTETVPLPATQTTHSTQKGTIDNRPLPH